ncbi:hypothetical protein AB5J72_44400 [Streptomyces sp. CG1]|uniref:hypothetical protein n=1 Tax=Streptomyces sp. CG1 TaxID=1287523 RepID=UPI0034E2AD88
MDSQEAVPAAPYGRIRSYAYRGSQFGYDAPWSYNFLNAPGRTRDVVDHHLAETPTRWGSGAGDIPPSCAEPTSVSGASTP